MTAPVYSKEEALKKHIEILVLKRKRFDGLIELTDKVLKGETEMSFNAFNDKKIIELQKLYLTELLRLFNRNAAVLGSSLHCG